MQGIPPTPNLPEFDNKWWKNPIFIVVIVGIGCLLIGGVLGGGLVWKGLLKTSPSPEKQPAPPVLITPDSAKTQLDWETASRLADGNHRTFLKVTLKDSSENPVPNQSVQVASSEQTDILQDYSASTNQQGVALFPLTYKQPGIRTITVQSNGMQLLQKDIELPEINLSTEVEKIVERVPPVTVQLISTIPEGEDGIRAVLELTVRKPDGTALAGEKIKVIIDRTSKPREVSTNGKGKATVPINYSPSERERLITVTRNGTEVGKVNFPLPKIEARTVEKRTVVPPPIAIAVTRTALGDDGDLHADLEIMVRDEEGKPRAGIPIQLKSGNADTFALERNNNRTNQQGRIKVYLTSKQSGTRTITVTYNGGTVGRDEIYLPKIEPRTEMKEKVVVVPPPIEIEVRSVTFHQTGFTLPRGRVSPKSERTGATVQDDNHIKADLELTCRNPDGTTLANQEIEVLTNSELAPRRVRTNGQGKVTVSLTYAQPEKQTIVVKQGDKEVGQAAIYLPEVKPAPLYYVDLTGVELPADVTSRKAPIKFFIKSSRDDSQKVEALLTPNRRGLLFLYDSRLKLEQKSSIYVAFQQDNATTGLGDFSFIKLYR